MTTFYITTGWIDGYPKYKNRSTDLAYRANALEISSAGRICGEEKQKGVSVVSVLWGA